MSGLIDVDIQALNDLIAELNGLHAEAEGLSLATEEYLDELTESSGRGARAVIGLNSDLYSSTWLTFATMRR